jgi:MFS family permease
VLNAYTLVFASLLLTAGALGDRFGAKRVFVTGFALFTAASLACGMAGRITPSSCRPRRAGRMGRRCAFRPRWRC